VSSQCPHLSGLRGIGSGDAGSGWLCPGVYWSPFLFWLCLGQHPFHAIAKREYVNDGGSFSLAASLKFQYIISAIYKVLGIFVAFLLLFSVLLFHRENLFFCNTSLGKIFIFVDLSDHLEI
jgi:membrane-associated PAP2 superfamily phosphatase